MGTPVIVGKVSLRRDIGLELGSLSSSWLTGVLHRSPAEVLGALCAPGAMAVLRACSSPEASRGPGRGEAGVCWGPGHPVTFVGGGCDTGPASVAPCLPAWPSHDPEAGAWVPSHLK